MATAPCGVHAPRHPRFSRTCASTSSTCPGFQLPPRGQEGTALFRGAQCRRSTPVKEQAGEGQAGKPRCKHAEDCPMYDLFAVSGTIKIWQLSYCDSDFRRCSRYQKSCRNEVVPQHLLPNGRLLGGHHKAASAAPVASDCPSPRSSVRLHERGVFIAELHGDINLELIDRVLEEIWSHPQRESAWTLVVRIPEGAHYDPDVRLAALPERSKRAAGVAVVLRSAIQRTVVQSIGLGLRVGSGFLLSAHKDVDSAIDWARETLASAPAQANVAI